MKELLSQRAASFLLPPATCRDAGLRVGCREDGPCDALVDQIGFYSMSPVWLGLCKSGEIGFRGRQTSGGAF